MEPVLTTALSEPMVSETSRGETVIYTREVGVITLPIIARREREGDIFYS